MNKRIKRAFSLIMALVITITSINFTDVGTIKAQAEENELINEVSVSENQDISYDDGDSEDELPLIGFYYGEERSKDKLISTFEYDRRNIDIINVIYRIEAPEVDISDYEIEVYYVDPESGEEVSITSGLDSYLEQYDSGKYKVKINAVNKGIRIVNKETREVAYEIWIGEKNYTDLLMIAPVRYDDEDKNFYFDEDAAFYNNQGFGVDETHYMVLCHQTGEGDDISYSSINADDLSKLSIKAFSRQNFGFSGELDGNTDETDVTLRVACDSINYTAEENSEYKCYNSNYTVFELVGSLNPYDYFIFYDPDGSISSKNEMTGDEAVGECNIWYPDAALYSYVNYCAASLIPYEYYYTPGDDFYILWQDEQIKDITVSVWKNREDISLDDVLTTDFPHYFIKEDIKYAFSLQIEITYKDGRDNNNRWYNFEPAKSIRITDYINNYRNEDNEEVFEFVDNDCFNYSNFYYRDEFYLHDGNLLAFAFVQRNKDGSVEAEALDLENCALSVNGEEVVITDYFKYVGDSEYTLGGKYDCPEELNATYKIYEIVFNEIGTYTLTYNKGEESFVYTINCVLPDSGFYSKNEISNENFIDCLDYTSKNNTVYLLKKSPFGEDEEWKIDGLIIYTDGKPEEEIPSGDFSKYFTATEVNKGLEIVLTDKAADCNRIDFIINEDELRVGLNINDCRPGLRICDNFDFGGWSEEEQKQIIDGFRYIDEYNYAQFYKGGNNVIYNETYYFALAYYNNGTYKPLKSSDIKVKLNGTELKNAVILAEENMHYDFDEANNNNYNIYYILADKLGTYEISYDPTPKNTTNKDTVTLKLNSVFPEIAMFSSPERNADSYLGYMFFSNKNNKTFYLLTDENFGDYKLSLSEEHYGEVYSKEEKELDQYLDIEDIEGVDGVKVTLHDFDSLENELVLKVNVHYCDCENPDTCEYYSDYCEFRIRNNREPEIRVYDHIDIDWETDRVIQIRDDGCFWSPNEAIEFNYEDAHYFAFAYAVEDKNDTKYTPLTSDKFTLKHNDATLNVKDVFTLALKDQLYNGEDYFASGKKYDIYKITFPEAGEYVLTYDPDATKEGDEVSLIFRIGYPDFAFMTDTEIDKDNIINNYYHFVSSATDENKVYFRALNDEKDFILYYVEFNEVTGMMEYKDTIYDSTNPDEYNDNGLTVKQDESSSKIVEITYDGTSEKEAIIYAKEEGSEIFDEWGNLERYREFYFTKLYIYDGNIKTTYAVGNEITKDKLYVDYVDAEGYRNTIAAKDLEKLGYEFRLEYAFGEEPYTLEPNADGKLIFVKTGLYIWNLYKDDVLYANGNIFIQVFGKVYSANVGQKITIAGAGTGDERLNGEKQCIKVLLEADKTYRITVYPKNTGLTEYDSTVYVDGLFYNPETEEIEYGSLVKYGLEEDYATSKYIFFKTSVDGEVYIKPLCEYEEYFVIETVPEIINVDFEDLTPDGFEYYFVDSTFVGASPDDFIKIQVDYDNGTSEKYDIMDALSNFGISFDDNTSRISGQVAGIELFKDYSILRLDETDTLAIGATTHHSDVYKIELEADTCYEFKVNRMYAKNVSIQLIDPNLDFVIDEETLNIRYTATETGTYYVNVDGLRGEYDFSVKNIQDGIVALETEEETVPWPYGYDIESYSYLKGLKIYYGKKDTEEKTLLAKVNSDSQEKFEEQALYYGLTYRLLKSDKKTVAKKDLKGFYPAGTYYYEVTMDGVKAYSSPLNVIKLTEKYTISFLSNGKTTYQKDIKANEIVNLKANTETKKGYTFLGWTLDGSEEKIVRSSSDFYTIYFVDKQKVANLSVFCDEGTNTVELKAVWKRNTYTITYRNIDALDIVPDGNDDNGNYYRTTYTVENSVINLLNPDMCSEPFYMQVYSGFLDWYEDENYTKKVTEIKPTDAKDYVLYAKLEPHKFTISFDTGITGKTMDSITVYNGSIIDIPTCSYKKDGCVFMGWSVLGDENSICEKSYDRRSVEFVDYEGTKFLYLYSIDGESMIYRWLDEDDNITLQAIWQNEFNIKYLDISGNEYYPGENVEETYSYGQEKTITRTPAREGYTFSGWYRSGTKVTKITKTTSGDIVLVAKWTPKTYKVEFDKNGGSGTAMKSQTLTYDKAATLSANKYTRPGYKFLGWNTDKNAEEPLEIGAAPNLATGGKVTLYAIWAPTTYKVNFELGCNAQDVSGDDFDIEEIVVEGEGYSYTTYIIKPLEYSYSTTSGENLYTVTRDGYDFDGWYKDAKYSKKITSTKGLAADITVYAKWSARYKIVFNANAGAGTVTGSMSDITNIKMYEAKKLTKNKYTYKDEFGNVYAFMGWSTYPGANEADYANEEKIKIASPDDLCFEGDKLVLNLYAVWRRSFNVDYVFNGGTVGDVEYIYLYGTGIKSLPTPYRDGYKFDGWYKDEKFKTKKVTSIGTKESGDVVLYAKWTGLSYEINFDANAPEGLKASGKMTKEKMTFGTEKALTKNAFKITGYQFVGWSIAPIIPLDADDSIECCDFYNAEKVSQISNIYSGKVTLYAVWMYIPTTITVYVNGVEDFTITIDDPTYIGKTITLADINDEYRSYNNRTAYYDVLYTDKSCKKVFKGVKITSGEVKLYAKKRTMITY